MQSPPPCAKLVMMHMFQNAIAHFVYMHQLVVLQFLIPLTYQHTSAVKFYKGQHCTAVHCIGNMMQLWQIASIAIACLFIIQLISPKRLHCQTSCCCCNFKITAGRQFYALVPEVFTCFKSSSMVVLSILLPAPSASDSAKPHPLLHNGLCLPAVMVFRTNLSSKCLQFQAAAVRRAHVITKNG